MVDNHGREINYLRFAVTDRCNLRCNYCMPAEGIDFAPRQDLLTIEESIRLCRTMIAMGIDKIRFTGGEPFVRKGIMELFRALAPNPGLKELSVTTNATLIGPHIEELKDLGVTQVNISLDAIDPDTFKKITRRNHYHTVMENLYRLIDEGFQVRINFVVLEGQNIQDILPMMELQRNYPVAVRFLEEMPFNGGSRPFDTISWNYKKILEYLAASFPEFSAIPGPATATAINYRIPGHLGNFGVIPSFSRTFCGSCNRLRITAIGDVITCLYGKPKTNVRELIRSHSDIAFREEILKVLGQRAKTGFDAQKEHAGVFSKAMTSIGG